MSLPLTGYILKCNILSSFLCYFNSFEDKCGVLRIDTTLTHRLTLLLKDGGADLLHIQFVYFLHWVSYCHDMAEILFKVALKLIYIHATVLI